jgi:hypothetical protein
MNANVHNLEPEDLTLTSESVAMAAGGDELDPGAFPGRVGPPPGGAPWRAAGTGGLLATAE